MPTAASRHAAGCELIQEVSRTSGAVRLRVTGTSMLPAIWPNDLLSVRHCQCAELVPGQIVLFRNQGSLTAHRLVRICGDRLITRGDSLPACDPPVSASELIGRVEGIERNGRQLQPAHSTWGRLVAFILRRSNLAVHLALFVAHRSGVSAGPDKPDLSSLHDGR